MVGDGPRAAEIPVGARHLVGVDQAVHVGDVGVGGGAAAQITVLVRSAVAIAIAAAAAGAAHDVSIPALQSTNPCMSMNQPCFFYGHSVSSTMYYHEYGTLEGSRARGAVKPFLLHL
uniref:Uncharacterized protein n=1 Tax=Triticum urartu TaxID=4572 RepID=A0A8R7U4K3_TRIUA